MMTMQPSTAIVIVIAVLFVLRPARCSTWSRWWSYEGFSGPDYWGLVNRDWWMCSHGKQQSPVDIDPKVLLFDPNLQPLYVDNVRVNGTLENTGQYLAFTVDEKTEFPVFISGGPLGAYKYRAYKIILHFGARENVGSEHMIDGEHFSGEIQILGYNRDLYTNFSSAMRMPNGLVGIACLLEMKILRNMHRSEEKQAVPVLIAGDHRATKTLNNREIRTNINFNVKGASCSYLYRKLHYKANPWRKTNRLADIDHV